MWVASRPRRCCTRRNLRSGAPRCCNRHPRRQSRDRLGHYGPVARERSWPSTATGIRQLFKRHKIDTISVSARCGAAARACGRAGRRPHAPGVPCDLGDRFGSPHAARIGSFVRPRSNERGDPRPPAASRVPCGNRRRRRGRRIRFDVSQFRLRGRRVRDAPRIVPLEDEEVSTALSRAFRAKGIDVFAGTAVDARGRKADGIELAFADQQGGADEAYIRETARGGRAQTEH